MRASNYDDVSANFSRRGTALRRGKRATFFDVCVHERGVNLRLKTSARINSRDEKDIDNPADEKMREAS